MQARADSIDDTRLAMWGDSKDLKRILGSFRAPIPTASPKMPERKRGA